MSKREITIPEGMFPATEQLVVDFAEALAAKLRAAERKHGYSDGWLVDDWQAHCLEEMHRHIAKGDPIDVALYCGFLWKRGWKTGPNRRVENLLRDAFAELSRQEPRRLVER
jgi:hypothetical protein